MPSSTPSSDQDEVKQWLAAAAQAGPTDALRAIYTMISDQISARRPACWASGRCCNFAKTGHRLYTTGFEAAYALLNTPRGAPALTTHSLDAAVARGDCPFLISNLCGMHSSKPMGCRVYFCDTSAQEWQIDLSERAMVMIRQLHTEHNISYRYAEWRYLLSGLLSANK